MRKLRMKGKANGASVDVREDPTALEPDHPSSRQEPLNESAPRSWSVEAPEQPQTNPSSPNSPTSPPSASARRFPKVTVEEWPEPEDGLSDPEYDGLQIPEEDAFRDPEDVYACAHDDQDDSEAAQQFSDFSDPDFLEFLRREVGDLIDEDIQSICK
ncbi:hypothetical protein BDV93DRAFT_546051 [Ceratobasidium sp. AG-I]|nr:hypothetical protein BDV93DRAFT_546051 [Ceratobasidium sp. AG-I]